MHNTDSGRNVYGSELSSPGDTSTRFALASLVGSDLFWAAFVVVLPVLLVAASVLHPVGVSFAAGLPAVVCLWLLWMSHEFVDTRFEVDVEGGRVRKSKPYSNEYYSAISADEIEDVSILEFSQVALLRFRYEKTFVSKPLAVAVEPTDVQDVKSDLDEMEVDVSIHRKSLFSLSTDSTHLRVLGTPVVVLGALVAAGALHGSSAFAATGFVVPMLVAVLFALYGGFYRNRLDHDGA
jgi:hypothetical protein